jgi:hypothetical protein
MGSDQGGGYLARPEPSGLADVVDIVLDKGLVIDAYVRVSLLGIELLTIDARLVVASVDTYLRFAEATNRLNLRDKGGRDLSDLVTEGTGAVVEHVASNVAQRKVEGVLDAAASTVADATAGPVEAVMDTAEDLAGAAAKKVQQVTTDAPADDGDVGDSSSETERGDDADGSP